MPNDGELLDALGVGFVGVGGRFVCDDIHSTKTLMPKFTKYLWLLFGFSLCGVFFGHLCTLNMIAAGVLLFFYSLYVMLKGGILTGWYDYYHDRFVGIICLPIFGIILYQYSKVLVYCGCWPE